MAAKVVEKDTSSDFEKDERIIEFKKMKTDIEKKNFFKKHKTFFRDYLLNYESLQRGINNEIVLFNETMVAHGKYKKFLSEGQPKKELYLSSDFLPGETKFTCPYVDFTKKGDFFQEGYKSSPVGKFESNFEEIATQMSNNMLTTKEKHDEAQVRYEKLLKKKTGGVSSNILDETNEELTKIMKEYEAEAIRIGKQHMNDERKIFPLKESIFDVVFDTPLTIDGKNFYKPDPELSSKIMVAIEKGIDQGSLDISRKLPDKIDKDYKLVNLMIENGELNSTDEFTQTDTNPILSLNKEKPLLAYMDKSGRVNYESVMGDFSKEKIKIIKLRDGAKAGNPTNTGALILNVVYPAPAFEWTTIINKNDVGVWQAAAAFIGALDNVGVGALRPSQQIILRAFYNDVLSDNAQGKTYLDVRYNAKFKDDDYFETFFEVELVDISQKMKDIYKIYTDKLLEKFFSKIKKLKESTRSQCDDVRKKYNRKKDDIKTQGKQMVGEVKSSDSSFTEIMELLGSEMLSMVFYGNDSKKYPVVNGFTPEKTKVEIINNGLLWLPYIDYEKLTTDGFDGSNILFKVATGSIFDPGTEVTATTKYIEELYLLCQMKFLSMKDNFKDFKDKDDGDVILKKMNCQSLTEYSKISAVINNFCIRTDNKRSILMESTAIIHLYFNNLIERGDDYLIDDSIFSVRAISIIRASPKGLVSTVGRDAVPELNLNAIVQRDPDPDLFGSNLTFDHAKYGKLGYVASFFYSELGKLSEYRMDSNDITKLIMNLFVFESTFETCDILYKSNLSDLEKRKIIEERRDEGLRYACRYCIKVYRQGLINNDAHYYAAYAAYWCIINSISEPKRSVLGGTDHLDEYVMSVAKHYHDIRVETKEFTHFEKYVGFPGLSKLPPDPDPVAIAAAAAAAVAAAAAYTDWLNSHGNIHTTFSILQRDYMLEAANTFGGGALIPGPATTSQEKRDSLDHQPEGSITHDGGFGGVQLDVASENNRLLIMKRFLYFFRENAINADVELTKDTHYGFPNPGGVIAPLQNNVTPLPMAMGGEPYAQTGGPPGAPGAGGEFCGPFDINFDYTTLANFVPFKIMKSRRYLTILNLRITPVILIAVNARLVEFDIRDKENIIKPPDRRNFVINYYNNCYGTINQCLKNIVLDFTNEKPDYYDIISILESLLPNLYGPSREDGRPNHTVMDCQCMFLKTGEQRKNDLKKYFSNLNGLYEIIDKYKNDSRIRKKLGSTRYKYRTYHYNKELNTLYDLEDMISITPGPLSVDSRVIDKKKLKEFINGNEMWLKYITYFLQYLDTDKNNMINGQNNVSYSIRTVNETNIFTNTTTCDDFKDEKTSFWVDVKRGGTKNTILDYMNLRYSITKKLEDGKKMHQIIEGNEKIFQSLKEDTKKEEKSDYLKEKATDALKFWTSSEDSKNLTLKALKEFGIEKFFGVIDKLGYAKVKDFMSLKKNPYGEMMKKNTPEVKSPEKVEGTLLTRPQPVFPNQMGVPIAQKGGGDEETLFENLSKSLDLNSEERVKLSKSIDYVQKKIYEEYEKKKDKKDKEKKGDKGGEDKESEDKEGEDKDKEEEGKVGEDKKDKKLEEIIKKKIDGIVEGDDGEAKYSDKDIEDIQIEYDRIIDEINIKKIKIRNLTNDLSSYQKTRMTTYDLAKEKIIQDLENNKKEIFRLKKEKESIYNQLKYMKLYVEEEKKRNEIKSKQREEYIRIEKEREIEKLLKIQQELKNIIHNSEKDKMELSSELYDKKTKKKLKSLNQKILSARENSLALKREDLYGSMEIPITTTKNTKNKKRTLKKKKQKKGKSKSVKKDNKRKNNRKTHKKNKKEEKKSLTKSLKKMIGMKV